MKMMTKAQKKVGKVMKEFGSGKLHSGKGGPVVKNPKQAIAIAMSEAKLPMRGQRTAKNKAKKVMATLKRTMEQVMDEKRART
jgi:hypothetical protein